MRLPLSFSNIETKVTPLVTKVLNVNMRKALSDVEDVLQLHMDTFLLEMASSYICQRK